MVSHAICCSFAKLKMFLHQLIQKQQIQFVDSKRLHFGMAIVPYRLLLRMSSIGPGLKLETFGQRVHILLACGQKSAKNMVSVPR